MAPAVTSINEPVVSNNEDAASNNEGGREIYHVERSISRRYASINLISVSINEDVVFLNEYDTSRYCVARFGYRVGELIRRVGGLGYRVVASNNDAAVSR